MLSLDGEADTLPMPEVHAPELPTLEVPSLDDALSASALPASRADGFSQSHNFASVSRSMPEGDLRQSLEGFLDDASHRQADMPVADLASLHSDPVHALRPRMTASIKNMSIITIEVSERIGDTVG